MPAPVGNVLSVPQIKMDGSRKAPELTDEASFEQILSDAIDQPAQDPEQTEQPVPLVEVEAETIDEAELETQELAQLVRSLPEALALAVPIEPITASQQIVTMDEDSDLVIPDQGEPTESPDIEQPVVVKPKAILPQLAASETPAEEPVAQKATTPQLAISLGKAATEPDDTRASRSLKALAPAQIESPEVASNAPEAQPHSEDDTSREQKPSASWQQVPPNPAHKSLSGNDMPTDVNPRPTSNSSSPPIALAADALTAADSKPAPQAQPAPNTHETILTPREVEFASGNHDRIVTAIRTQLLPRGGSMQIRLDPPNLGTLELAVRMQDGIMSVSFQTSSEEATRLLSHSLSQLKGVLESQGLSVDKLHVQQASRDHDASRQDADQQRHDLQDETFARQEHERREMLRRMWRRLALGSDPLDLVA